MNSTTLGFLALALLLLLFVYWMIHRRCVMHQCAHMDEILPNLYVGNAVSATSAHLRDHQIDAVVNCAKELDDPDVQELQLDYLHLPLKDSMHQSLTKSIDVATPWIQDQLSSGKVVLIHCAMGRSRSVAILIAFLQSLNKNLSAEQALAFIRTKRPCANPNPNFMRQLDKKGFS